MKTSTPRNPVTDTVAAVVVAFLVWIAVSILAHAVLFLLAYFTHTYLSGFASPKKLFPTLFRTVVSTFAGTVFGIHTGKRWFPAARIWPLYYSFAVILFCSTVVLPVWLSSLPNNEGYWHTKEQLWGMFAGVASIVAGYYVAKGFTETAVIVSEQDGGKNC
jgi:H+/Cl- antiporter ClcA